MRFHFFPLLNIIQSLLEHVPESLFSLLIFTLFLVGLAWGTEGISRKSSPNFDRLENLAAKSSRIRKSWQLSHPFDEEEHNFDIFVPSKSLIVWEDVLFNYIRRQALCVTDETKVETWAFLLCKRCNYDGEQGRFIIDRGKEQRKILKALTKQHVFNDFATNAMKSIASYRHLPYLGDPFVSILTKWTSGVAANRSTVRGSLSITIQWSCFSVLHSVIRMMYFFKNGFKHCLY